MTKIYAILGPHAAGKSTLLKILRNRGFSSIVSHTTRKITDSETNNIEYKFVSKENFLKLDLVEKSTYQGNYYGIEKNELLNKMQENKINFVIVDKNGLKQLKKLLSHRIESIYIMVDYVTMVERMLKRGETNANIKKQLEYAEANGEFDNWKICDHIVKNVLDVDISIRQILAIINRC